MVKRLLQIDLLLLVAIAAAVLLGFVFVGSMATLSCRKQENPDCAKLRGGVGEIASELQRMGFKARPFYNETPDDIYRRRFDLGDGADLLLTEHLRRNGDVLTVEAYFSRTDGQNLMRGVIMIAIALAAFEDSLLIDTERGPSFPDWFARALVAAQTNRVSAYYSWSGVGVVLTSSGSSKCLIEFFPDPRPPGQ